MAPRTRSGRKTSSARTVPARVVVVVSRYNESVTGRLLDGAQDAFRKSGERAELVVVDAPGAFELPALSLAAAGSPGVRGVVALGCLIKGETSHDRYIADAVAHGLVDVTLRTGVPVAFGVLTTDTAEQAAARAGGDKGNKGAEAMEALIATIRSIDALTSGRSVQPVRRPDKASRGVHA